MAYASTLPFPLSKTSTGGLKPTNDEDHAFVDLVERYERVVYHVALRVVRNREDAEDVAQEVWLRVARSQTGLRDQSRLLPWLCRISHNCAVSLAISRRDRLQVPTSDTDEDPFSVISAPASEGPEQQVISIADQREVRTALMTLPERDRRMLILREFKGLPYAEIGKVLNISTGNAEVSVFRARARLRDRLSTPGGL